MRLLYTFVLLVGLAGASEKQPKPKRFECICGSSFSVGARLMAHLEKFKGGLRNPCVCGRHFYKPQLTVDGQIREALRSAHERNRGHNDGNRDRNNQLGCFYCTTSHLKDGGRFNAGRVDSPPRFTTEEAQVKHLYAKHVTKLTVDDILGERTIIVPMEDPPKRWTEHSFSVLSDYLKEKAKKRAEKSSQGAKGVKRKRTPSSGPVRFSKRLKRSSA